MASGSIPYHGGEQFFRSATAEEIQPPIPIRESTVVAAGKTTYQRYCIQCHGPHFDGNGTVGQSFAPLPGDLRSEKVQSMAEGSLFKEISYGIPGGRQPALATTIAVNDRWNVIAFLKSLGVRE
jgi:mono/diheme cytochrome c family protein